jgi:hypothetical protein
MALRDLYLLEWDDPLDAPPEPGQGFDDLCAALVDEDVFGDKYGPDPDPSDVRRWVSGLRRLVGDRSLRRGPDWAYETNFADEPDDRGNEPFWVRVGKMATRGSGWTGPVYQWTEADDGWRELPAGEIP